jgi:hypothetical protein
MARPLTPELREQLQMELAELSRKNLTASTGKPTRRAKPGALSRIKAIQDALDEDDKRLASEHTYSAPVEEEPKPKATPTHKIKVGDVFTTPDKNAVIIVTENNDSFMVAYVAQLGKADHVAWAKLKAKGQWILKATCDHHVRVCNWAYETNIEKTWSAKK